MNKLILKLICISITFSALSAQATTHDVVNNGEEIICNTVVKAVDLPYKKSNSRVWYISGVNFMDATLLISSYANLLKKIYQQNEGLHYLVTPLEQILSILKTISEDSESYNHDVYRLLCESHPELCISFIADQKKLINIQQSVNQLISHLEQDSQDINKIKPIMNDINQVLMLLNDPHGKPSI